ncbi:hypothetical protein Tco_0003636 [Tanacetum coccineum]
MPQRNKKYQVEGSSKLNNEAECEPIKMAKKEEMTEVSSSHPVEYYLKHVINKKLIEGLVDNHRFNDFLSRARARKTKRKTYNISLKGPVMAISVISVSSDSFEDSRSPVIPRRRVMILAPGQPIPHGRPYRYHLNGPINFLQMISSRFFFRFIIRGSSSDFIQRLHPDFLRDILSGSFSPIYRSTSAMAISKRRLVFLWTFVPALPPVAEALSPVHANLIPSPKRIRSPESATDLEGCSKDSFEPYIPREVGLGVYVKDESSEQSRSRGTDIEVDDDVERSDGLDINPVEAVIEACFGFADIIRTSGVDVRVEVVTLARDDVETGTRDPIIVSDDGDTPPVVSEEIPEPAQEGAAGVIEGVQREQGHRIVRVESTVTALTERVVKLERDNRRLRGTEW